ncbi:MAG TPA: hypothetical protein VFM14_15220 [Gemmatimonadales bacterium]|nr:hypothetical protein [Gemmatimonadales bacterium]
MVHYEDTIKKKVTVQRLAKFIPTELKSRLISIFGGNPIAVWGSEAGPRNRSIFERMTEGDDVLIVEGASIKLMGKIAAKVASPALSRELWKPLTGSGNTTWELIYFIANARELDLPFSELCGLLGWRSNFQLRGLTTVAPARLSAFYERYDDLYSVLTRLQKGEPVSQLGATPTEELKPRPDSPDLVELEEEDVEEVLRSDLVSDHVRMQWMLARLGLKAGERVWVPAADQKRLRKNYGFESFDEEFTAGIDLPHSYVENIDVVWKQEFRIGAAYEIENSTSIYSGLLRFADLTILAPNTTYPMFVVAPASRRNRLREQLRRPVFQGLKLGSKVHFLSYEHVQEIDEFFAASSTGLSVDLVVGKSELVA